MRQKVSGKQCRIIPLIIDSTRRRDLKMNNTTIEEKLREIEELDYIEYMFEAGKMFNEVLNLTQKYNKPDIQKVAEAELKLLNLDVYHPIINDIYIERFDDRIISNNHFSREEILYFESRLTDSLNVFLKSRYADFLFEYGQGICSKNKYEIGTKLVECMIETAELHFHKDNPIMCLEDLARAVFVSLQLKNRHMIVQCNDFLFEVLNKLEGRELRWVLEIAELIRQIVLSSLESSVDNDQRQVVLSKLEQARTYYWDNKEHHLHRSVCEELIEWGKAIKMDKSLTLNYLKEIGASFEAEAEHQQGRTEQSELVKATFLEKALHHYMNYGFSDTFDDLKKRIKSSYEQAVANGEFITASSSINIPQEDIDKEIQPYLNVTLEQAISNIASEVSFIPNISRIEQNTKKQMQAYSLSDLFGKSVVADGKKIFQTVGDNDTYKINFNKNYILEMQIMASIIMVPLFEKLMDKGLVASHILDKLLSWGYIDVENESIIKVGFERFFEKDYISSMHILVPQLESVVRKFFGKIGFATTVIKKGTVQQEQTFNEFLERKDIKEAIPKEIHKYLVMLLVEQTGSNLRNKIAHGLIHPSECNIMNNVLVIHFYLLLTNFILEPIE